MISKILGILDLFIAIGILLFQYNLIPYQVIISLSLYLIIKTIIFFGDFFSIVDGIVGLYMLLMAIFRIELISYIFIIYLIIKGIWSML